jgi:hypothetical protein
LGWGMRAERERERERRELRDLFVFFSLRLIREEIAGLASPPSGMAWFDSWAAIACLDQLRP